MLTMSLDRRSPIRNHSHRLVVGVALAALVPLVVSIASPQNASAVVDVSPGVGTLQAAIDAAHEGSTLRLHPGTYIGAVTVNKALTLKGESTVYNAIVIDAHCGGPVALDIAADHVKIKSSLTEIFVTGGTATAIRIANHNHITLKHIFVVTRFADFAPCGTEQDGVEISGSSAHVELAACEIEEGFPHAGLYMSGLSIGSKVKINAKRHSIGSVSNGNGVGVLIENSANGAALGKAGITLQNTEMSGNSVAGLRVVNSDGIVISRNVFTTNAGVGLDLDSMSDMNLISHNVMYNGDTIANNGSGNCGSLNDGFIIPTCR
jgi:nitrous oxidase accessory protein NosD